MMKEMYIRDANVQLERLLVQARNVGFSPTEPIHGVTFEMIEAMLVVGQNAEKLMGYTARDGEERVVVVRGFGRDYARAMNKIRQHMSPIPIEGHDK